MNKHIREAAWFAALTCASVPALAQPAMDLGRLEYQSSCATCHGATGKGDGTMKSFLTQAPSDLTTIAKRHGGALPVELVWEMIDGRATQAIGPHGNREMPVWGNRFRVRAMEFPDVAGQPEWFVRGRIVALLEYLDRIQAK